MADILAAGAPGQSMAPRIRDPNFREIYSNGAITSLTPFDITITMQKTGEIAPGQVAVVDLASLTMSPQQLKAFVNAIKETLSAYEQAYGVLTIKDRDVTPLRSAEQIVEIIETKRESVSTSSPIGPPPPSEQSHGESQKKGKRP